MSLSWKINGNCILGKLDHSILNKIIGGAYWDDVNDANRLCSDNLSRWAGSIVNGKSVHAASVSVETCSVFRS